jgi:DSBA-like thioredoxin domain
MTTPESSAIDTTTSDITTIDFYFDPVCPWTWLTSRWLVDAAGQRGIDVQWRSLSLGVLNAGKEIPEQFRAPMVAGQAAHRVIAALLADDRNDLVGAFYTEFGQQTFLGGQAPTVDVVRASAIAAGAEAWVEAVDDDSWDAGVAASTHHSIGLAGPDVGSPIIAFGEPLTAIFGPIVSPAPTGADALRLLDRVLDTSTIPGFFELKRGRTAGPQFTANP